MRAKKQPAGRTRPPFSIETAIVQLGEDEQLETRQKLLELTTAIEAAAPGFTVRDDSRLAWQYATHTGDAQTMTRAQVVSEIVVIQHLYGRTSYNELLQKDMKEVAAAFKVQYPHIKWRDLWHIVREHMIPIIKLEAVARASAHGVELPSSP